MNPAINPMTGLPYPEYTEPWPTTPGWPYTPTFPPYYPPIPVFPQAQLCPVCMGSGRSTCGTCHGCGGRGWVVVGTTGCPPNITVTYSTGGPPGQEG